MRRVLFCTLALVSLVGCQGPAPVSPSMNVDHVKDLTAKGGTWESHSKKVNTEWTFRLDGTYGALHQEGNVAAQIRGTYKWEGETLVLTPNAVDARSIKTEEAKQVERRLKAGARWTPKWNSGDKFTIAPDSSDPTEFVRV